MQPPSEKELILGSLSPDDNEHLSLYINRDNEELELIELINSLNKRRITGGIAIFGSPGCGKSTFSRFLTHKIKTGHHEVNFDADVISLDMFNTTMTYLEKPIDSAIYMDFFQNFQDVLIAHTDKETRAEANLKKLKDNKQFTEFYNLHSDYGNNDLTQVKDLAWSLLSEDAKLIKKRIVLFIDNIDLVPNNQVFILIDLITNLRPNDPDFQIVFTARPMTTAIIKCFVRRNQNYNVREVFLLKELSIKNVLETRFSGTSSNLSSIFSDQSIDYISELCCGNIDRALSVITATAEREHTKTQYKFEEPEKLHRFLFVKDKIPEFLIKVLGNEDKIPYIFCILLCLDTAQLINEDFTKKVNNLAQSIRGKELQKGLSLREISNIISSTINMYVTRRVYMKDLSTLMSILDNRKETINTYVALTEGGLTLLKYFHHLLDLDEHILNYPIPVQQFISTQRSYSNYTFTSESPDMARAEWH